MAGPVIERLALRGDETVLDAGCGSGRVTKLLLERLPEGRVIAVDAAPSMVEEARAALGPGVEVIQSDLTELELDERVDAVFSNAVFHWVPDHDALFARLRAALRPGGRLVAQCGGAGNVERFHEVAKAVGDEEPFAEYLAGLDRPVELRRRRRRPSGGWPTPASTTCGRGSTRIPWCRSTRSSTCAPCVSATTSCGFPKACATNTWPPSRSAAVSRWSSTTSGSTWRRMCSRPQMWVGASSAGVGN